MLKEAWVDGVVLHPLFNAFDVGVQELQVLLVFEQLFYPLVLVCVFGEDLYTALEVLPWVFDHLVFGFLAVSVSESGLPDYTLVGDALGDKFGLCTARVREAHVEELADFFTYLGKGAKFVVQVIEQEPCQLLVGPNVKLVFLVGTGVLVFDVLLNLGEDKRLGLDDVAFQLCL